MKDDSTFNQIKKCFESGQRFVITSHVNPDGDALGSEAALAGYLKSIGKEVLVYNSNATPANYSFLDSNNSFIQYQSPLHRETILTADYMIILDISDWPRLRDIGKDIRELDIKKICIDHHPTEDPVGDILLINTDASSTGEILFELLQFCDAKISKKVAEALFTSLMTDTGSFRFSNTTQRTLQVAAELVRLGAKPPKVYANVYEQESYAKAKLQAYVINNLKFEAEGRVAWFSLSKELLDRMGVKQTDTEGLSDYPRRIQGVEIAIMFSVIENNRIKISLRSKGKYVINKIAQKLGGGGHPFAAGILLTGNLKEVSSIILNEIKPILPT